MPKLRPWEKFILFMFLLVYYCWPKFWANTMLALLAVGTLLLCWVVTMLFLLFPPFLTALPGASPKRAC